MDTNPSDQARLRECAQVERDYPNWRAWPGVIPPLMYARRPNSSPPLVVRAASSDELRQAIEDAERERGLR